MLSTPYFCNFSVILLTFRVFAKFASYNFVKKGALAGFCWTCKMKMSLCVSAFCTVSQYNTLPYFTYNTIPSLLRNLVSSPNLSNWTLHCPLTAPKAKTNQTQLAIYCYLRNKMLCMFNCRSKPGHEWCHLCWIIENLCWFGIQSRWWKSFHCWR